MTEDRWSSKVRAVTGKYLTEIGSLEALRKRWSPWEELSAEVKSLFEKNTLSKIQGSDIYAKLVSVFEKRPRIRGKFKTLAAFHDGESLKAALLRLVSTKEQGDPESRIKALQLGGLGKATASEILCLWWPYRFLPQNAVSCKALSAMVPVYRRRDLEELPYGAFLNLADSLEHAFRETAEGFFNQRIDWLKEKRFLFFYAFLTETGQTRRKGPGGRPN